jgi:prepilin-type processing-associated H-X9-DG protein
VGLSEFGERTFLLDALPPFVKVPDARRFVLDLVDELKAAGREVNLARLGEHTVAKTVCRHAVKANDPLGGAELENLVEDLRRCAMPYTCPHGRPTLIEMNYRELEKKFGRTHVHLFDTRHEPAIGTWSYVHTNLHNRGAQFVFLDGHAARFKNTEYWNFKTHKGITNNPALVWIP